MATFYKALSGVVITGSWGGFTAPQIRSLYTCPQDKFAVAFLTSATTDPAANVSLYNSAYDTIKATFKGESRASFTTLLTNLIAERTPVFLSPGSTLMGQVSGTGVASFTWSIHEFESGVKL